MIEANQPEAPAREPRRAETCSHCRCGIAAAILLLTLIVRFPFLPTPGFIGDQTQFLMWSSMSRSDGIESVYSLRPDGSGKYWCNYPPGYVYVLRALAIAYRGVSGRDLDDSVIRGFIVRDDSPATRWAAALYKLPAVAADAILAVLLFLLLAGRIGTAWATLVAVLYALMPAVIHNSAVWGQTDAIPTLLVIASLEMARRKRALWTIGFAGLAVLVKPQVTMMAPIWLAVVFCWTGGNWRRWMQAVVLAAAIIIVGLLPVRSGLNGVWKSYVGAAAYYPFTHLNGFSAWFIENPMIEPHLGEMSAGAAPGEPLSKWYIGDAVPGFLEITHRTWGLLGVACVSLYVLIYLLRARCDDRSLLWAARLLPLAFFVLPTQMHERYLFPAIAIWAWTAGRSWRWFLGWLLIGLCASLNVLWSWAGPSGAGWATWCTQLLHRPWLGVAPGVWCSMVLCGLLVVALLDWADPADGPIAARPDRRPR
jgi:dolichyl-phosphate-mannose-protein mannosyltransferase